ncbi:MAG: threonine export protein RhtC [Acidobacteriaceae bacterium]
MQILFSLLTLAGVHLIAVASPGPGFLSVVQTSLRNPRKIMLLHVLGMGLASALWACAAAFGVQALLVRVAWLYRILELAGGVYLAWVGVQSWRHSREELVAQTAPAPDHLRPLQAVRRGFATNIANPKVMVFYVSIFTAILRPETPGWVRLCAIGITLVDNMLWYGSVGLLLSTAPAQAGYGRAKTMIDRVSGSVMFLFGLKLIWSARRAA